MLFLFIVLANHSVDNSLQDIFFWYYAFHIFDQVVCIGSLIILEVVDNQIKSSLWDHIDEWRENLKSILTTSKHNKVMS